jgi:hypothetical protein
MNLHNIVRKAITTVNNDILATLERSNGFTTDAAGNVTPLYLIYSGMVQVQGIDEGDYVHIANLEQQSVLRSVHLLGHWAGVIRAANEGGDLMKFPMFPGGAVMTWRVLVVKETWPDWCSVIVVLQT